MQFFVNGSPVCGDTVPLGVQGENLSTQITADVSGWLAQWPDGQVIVRLIDANRQSHLADTVVDDGTLVWIVTAADTAQGGYGVGVIELVQGDVVKKSEPFATRVITDPQASGEAPEPVPGWVEETIARMEELEAGAAQSAESAQTSAGSAQAGAQSAQAAAAQAAQSAEDAAAVLSQVEAAGADQRAAIQAAGQQQTQAVTAAGAQQVSAVQTEGADQRSAVQTAGAAQVNAVQAEGQTQQTAIQQKGADTLASIPADYTELSGDVADLKSQIAEMPGIMSSDATGVDLDVSDEDGNVILRLANGHVRSKYFDSAKASKTDNSDATGIDLDISDTFGNVIARFKDGHVQTKDFNSLDAVTDINNLKNRIETYSKSAEYLSAITNTITIDHGFKKGDEIFFHLEDGNRYDDWGRYATYFEDNRAVTGNRRGSNGYFRHIITADCDSVGITIAANEYANNTPLTLYVYKINGVVEPKIVTLKTDGTGMFSTLRAAVDSITDANHLTNPYVIEVYPGTYDTLEGYTDEEIAEADTGGEPYTQDTMVGVKLTDGISLRGIGRCDEIILTASLDSGKWNSSVRGNISTLNIQGEGNIENVTIKGYNIRYCVHDDFRAPVNSHDRRILRNLKFDGAYLTYYPFFTTYGAGIGGARDYLIENCDFGYDLGIHSGAGASDASIIEVNNCSGAKFRIGDNAGTNDDPVNRVIINNCNFQLININRLEGLSTSHMQIEGVGCENAMICDTLGAVYRLGMVDLFPAGLTTGTLVKRKSSGLEVEPTHDAAVAYGIVIGSDLSHSYVQRTGYISSVILGITGLSIGDYITVDDSTNLIVAGGTSENAVGVVKTIVNNIAFIKLMI